MRHILSVIAAVLVALAPLLPEPARAQAPAAREELEALKRELERLQERIHRLEREQARPVAAPPAPVTAAPPPVAAAPPVAGEREVQLEREHLFETFGLPRPEIAGTRFFGFFVGSASWNSHIQMVPEFAGGAPTKADPGHLNFRFDRFGFGVAKTFTDWLSANASIEVESHRDRHTHGFDPAFGCPGAGPCFERFGAEEAETDVNLDKLALTVVAPLGNGVAVSFGRFDVPFGIERHDEPLNLTATVSEVFQFGRPNLMTGFLVTYQFTPWLDGAAWAVNRWESETTHDPFDDNNRDKSFGGRLGFTPLARDGLLNVGIGGFWGPEQDERTSNARWVVDLDFTWSPTRRFLLAGELVYGGEQNVSLRQRGGPIAAPAQVVDANWLGLYVLAHYDVLDWLGLSLRYGYFDDMDGARTGVDQVLQSFTVAPVVHLSRLIPDLRPTGATYARTRHAIDWVDVRLEYRLNHSNRRVFSDARPGVDILDAEHTGHQLQLQFVVNY
jgi:hypothetical protein